MCTTSMKMQSSPLGGGPRMVHTKSQNVSLQMATSPLMAHVKVEEVVSET